MNDARQAAPDSLVIRPPHPGDAPFIADLRHQPEVLRFTMSLPSDRVETISQFLEHAGPDDHLLVAEADGRVIGMAGLHVQRGKRRHVGEVGLMVHDGFQGRGIGRTLLERLLELADDYLGLMRVELTVMAHNTRAIRLYERLGFALEGRKAKDLFCDGAYVDVLIMGRVHPAAER